MFTQDGQSTTLQKGDIVAWDINVSGFKIWVDRDRERLLWHLDCEVFSVDIRMDERTVERYQKIDDYGPPDLIRMLIRSHCCLGFEKSESITRPMCSGGAYLLV